MEYTSYIFSNPPRDVKSAILVDADQPGRTISWEAYASGVKKVAVGLRENGLLEQQCVALLAPNDIYLPILGDAVTAAGGIFLSLPVAGRPDELVGYCKVAQVKWLCATPRLLNQALRTAKEAGIQDECVFVFDPPGLDDDSAGNTFVKLRFSNFLEYDKDRYVNPNLSKDPSTLTLSRLLTSGTAGVPKVTNISHEASIARLEQNYYGYTGKYVKNLQFVEMYHTSATRNRHKAAAGHHCMYISNDNKPLDILDLIGKYEIDSVMLPPRMMIAIGQIIREGIRSTRDLSSIRHVYVGGSQVPSKAMNDFRTVLATGASLRIGYASTELGVVSWQEWSSSAPIDTPGYVGSIPSNMEVKVIDPITKRNCAAGTFGEICGRSAQSFSGYCNNETATQAAFIADGQGKRWYRSDDRGYLSRDGHLFVTGRYKEIFKVETEDVAPTVVEATLLEHDGVRDAAVTFTEDRNDGRCHEVKAFVVLEERQRPTAQELVDFVAARLLPSKAPTGGVSMIGEIPRNPMMKIVTCQLKALEPLSGSVGYMKVSKN